MSAMANACEAPCFKRCWCHCSGRRTSLALQHAFYRCSCWTRPPTARQQLAAPVVRPTHGRAAAALLQLEGRCAPSRSMNPSIKRCTFKTYTSFPPLVPSSIINIETWKLLRIKRSQNAPLRASVKSGTAQHDHTARKKHPKNAPRTTLAIDLFARLTAGACHACCGCR